MSSLLEAAPRLFKDRQRILVAVSGGVDSMVLLHLLQRGREEFHWQLHLAHLNHCLRGRSSDADEQLVRRTAERLNIPGSTGRADVLAIAASRKVSTEMAARQARHEFLARIARQQGISTIALAHHADDQAELFFLRLLRGSSPEGLTGMAAIGPSPVDPALSLARPLLNFTKEQLLEYARREKIAFREDRSNQSADILRNRIRHQLLPLLERKYQRGFHAAVLRLMQILRDESRFVASASALAKESGEELETFPVALQRRIIHEELTNLGLQPSFELIEQLRAASRRKVMIGPAALIHRSETGKLSLEPVSRVAFDAGELVVLLASSGETTFDRVGVQWAITGLRAGRVKRLQYRPGTESFDADKVGDSIVLRHWRPGDRFQPIGMSRPVKLQDLFVNQKIARPDRHNLLIAATAAGEIVWVEGLRISERFKLDNASQRRLKWIWRRRL